MEEKYLNYSAADFACDHRFLEWLLVGDRDSRLFWEEFRTKYPETHREIDAAIRAVESIRANHSPLTAEELALEKRRLADNIRRRGRRRAIRGWAAAACFVTLVTAGSLISLPEENVAEQIAEIVASTEEPKVSLIIAGSEAVIIDGDADIEYGGDGGVSVTDDAGAKKQVATIDEAAAMNRLIVPGGKRSSLTLPDGSRIWINAGTTLEFPGRFANESREIHVDGEVYIEVAPDERRPFRLHTPNFSIRVIGTKFNVSAYKGDTRQSVVLLEGSVCVTLPEGNTMCLVPEDMLVMQDYTTNISKVDPSEYISWREGILNFDGQPLRRVLASVSRLYNMPIEVDYPGEIYISGKLLLFDDLTTVLENLTMIAPVKYGVKKGVVIITDR